MPDTFDVIGKTVKKRDGAEKATGRTRYLHDLALPRLAHGRILRARVPHARLVRVDASRARALPGVLAVLTGVDARARPGRVRGAAGGLRSPGGARAGRPAGPRGARHQPARAPLPVRPRRRGRRVRGGGGGRREHVSPAVRDAGVPGDDGRDRGVGRERRGPHDVDDDPGPLPLSARPRGGARDHGRPRACAAAAGGRQLRPRPRPLPDRRDRGAPRPARPAAGEDRVRPRGGVHRVPDPRAVHDSPAHRGGARRAPARARRPRHDRQRRLHLLGLDDPLRDALDRRGPLPRAERPLRHDDRLHQQPVLGLDARLRQPRVHVRRGVADGRAGRAPRDGPARAAPAERIEGGRREPAGVRAHLVRDGRVPRGGGRSDPARRAAAEARLDARHRLRGHVPRRRGRAHLPLGRLRRHRQARRLRQGHAHHGRVGDRPGLRDGAGDDRRGDARRAARARRRGQLRHERPALGRGHPREPDHLRRGQRRAPRRREGEGRAPRDGRGRARRARGDPRPQARRRVREGEPVAPARLRGGRARGALHASRPRDRRRGLLRPADGHARQGPPGQRLGRVHVGLPGGPRRRGPRDRQGRGPEARLRPRRRARAEPGRRRGTDPRRDPHGARLRAERAARRRAGPGAHAVLHGLRGPEGRRHARHRRAPDRDRGPGGAVRRQGARRVRRHPGRGRRGQRPEPRDRGPLHGAPHHARARPRGARGARGVRLLEGVRVLDLSRMLAGPYGALLLADMGAEVIKIEEPDGGDPIRGMGPPFLPDGESAYFLAINRNKKSVAIDLTKEAGREVFHDLVRRADVVLENFRPGVMERLGCGYAKLWALNQRVVLCSISAYGQEGPYRDWPAFDLALQAMGGAMSLTGEPGREPVRMGLPMGDLAGGVFGAFAVAGALWRRERTGEGAHIDLSLLDCQVSLLTYLAQYFWADGRVPGPLGSAHASVVPYGALATRDGHLIVAVFVEKFWSGFCRALGRPQWERDPRFLTNRDRVVNRETLMPLVEAEFRTRTTAEWLRRLQAEGVPAAPIQSVDRVLEDLQVRRRGMVVEMEHPVHGRLPTLGTPVKVDGAMTVTVSPPPRLGEHTDLVLREILKYPDARLAELRRAGAIR
ncbi:MAG: hypothetical protein DME15_11340 [Candidatus Rokuibacteriota bacterium]|nr:MAG: hypothetical protein DME15_11340 [Candidatus Rokubacteria bacterium]